MSGWVDLSAQNGFEIIAIGTEGGAHGGTRPVTAADGALSAIVAMTGSSRLLLVSPRTMPSPNLIWGAAELTDILNEIGATRISRSQVCLLGANGVCQVPSSRKGRLLEKKGHMGPLRPQHRRLIDRPARRRDSQRTVTGRTGNPGESSRNGPAHRSEAMSASSFALSEKMR